MTIANKVIWSEGMFIQPQHFQEQDNYFHSQLNAYQRLYHAYYWGVIELTIDESLLNSGKISLNTAQGIFSDGTIFNIPGTDHAPLIVEVDSTVKNEILYLAIPLKRPGVQEVSFEEIRNKARYKASEKEVIDNIYSQKNTNIMIGKLQPQLLLESQDTSQFSLIPIARILECKADGKIILDEAFIPTCLSSKASKTLTGFISEISALLEQRSKAISQRIGDINRSAGVSAIADFLLLQLTQRFGLLFQHLTSESIVHPEYFYRFLLELAGSLLSFRAPLRQDFLPKLNKYQHQDLQVTFSSIMSEIRQSFSTVIEPLAIPLPLEKREFGISVAQIEHKDLFEHSKFIIAASADISSEIFQREFPMQIKIGPVEQIRHLINLQLPGISLRNLPVAPIQIPFNSKYLYFELIKEGKWWDALKQSGGIAIHTSGDFENLQLELWAIRGE
jgi:type VI secretion system protein ImpJ